MADPDPASVPSPAAASGEAAGNVHDLGLVVETGAQRVRRLQHEAHVVAKEQIEILARDFSAMCVRASEIADGGEAYPVGVRELCSRIADELAQQVQTLLAIMERAPRS